VHYFVAVEMWNLVSTWYHHHCHNRFAGQFATLFGFVEFVRIEGMRRVKCHRKGIASDHQLSLKAALVKLVGLEVGL